MKTSALLAMIFCATGAFGQALPYVPRPAAAFISITGLPGSWNALAGSGAATIPYVPSPVGLYCSNDSSGNAGTWVPCSSITAQVTAGAGSAGTPSITSSVDTTTGWHFPFAGQAEWSSGGFDQMLWSSGLMAFRNTMNLRWNSAGPGTAGNDTGISRGAAGVITIDTTANGNALGTLKVAAVLPGAIYSAAGTALPTCAAGIKGQSAVVSDATTPTYLGTYASGGAVAAAVLCNGTNWVTH